jgi:hypothetical protein
LAAKAFFQQIIDSKVYHGERPTELDKINCTIFSSIDPGNVKIGTLEDSCKMIRDAVSSTKKDKWKPIEMTLKDIPAQIEARIRSEKLSDVDYEKERHFAMMKAIIKESNVISKLPSISRVPPFEKVMCQFLDLMAPFRKEMESFHLRLFEKRLMAPEQYLSEMKPISDLLMDITNWLIRRRKEIENMCLLLSDTNLCMTDLEEIKNSVSSGKEKSTRVFILKMDCFPDPRIDNLAKFIRNQEPFKLPIFLIEICGKHRIEHCNQLLKAFSNKNTDYSSQIGLVPISSSMNDGTVIRIGYNTKDFLEITATELPDKETVCGTTGRVAEMFAQETNRYAKLIKRGQPNVYLLNANEKLVDKDFRWFNIDKPGAPFTSEDDRDHKVIILMGATGCGKSTLINGMVNYILDVQWNDPFRFKCVRDDVTINRQTSLVTAYTLRHHEGMAIPYSITIIDTPGYGETNEVQRDKLITDNIHRFLTQEEICVDEIHAACFVAASGDSRLTATQRYIDSVLSIFGKDVMPNMRLLVTFTNNVHPPVVKACLAAQFPVTSESAGITFCKFNSSVLYVSNKKIDGDVFWDEGLFWDWDDGQNNFYKFFSMLEGMKGQNLKSTREVIQRRQQLKKSLKDIKSELEASLSTIEKIRPKLRECSHNMEANKNFVLEKTEVRKVEVKCDEGLYAYNCMRCKKICEKPEKIKNFEKKMCTDKDCNCPSSYHIYQPFALLATSAKVTATQKDMKAEYEANFQQKLTSEDELNMAKGKVLTPLEQLVTNARLLDSTDRRSNYAKYLSLMKSRVLEKQAPGYKFHLQILTEMQESLNAPAVLPTTTRTDKFTPVQPNNNQPENKTRSCGHGRGISMQEINSTVNQIDLSGQSKIPLTGTADNGNGTGARSQIQMTGINGDDSSVCGAASTASSSAQTTSQGTNLDKEAGRVGNIPSTQEESSSYVYSGSQVVHLPDATENYYTASKETSLPCQTKGEESNQEREVSPSYHRGENKDGLSSSNEEMEQRNTQSKKTRDELAQSIISKFWSSR